jgi:hypothetical protein
MKTHNPRYEYMKKYREDNPDYVERHKEKRKKYLKDRPWYGSWSCAKTRCTNEKVKCFHRYGGRGIEFLLTKEDVAFLWGRDKADEMDKPTLDKINNDGNYELDNCRFIEKSENSTKGNYEARWV